MLTDFFAIKLGMSQAWTRDGRRLAVTKLRAEDNLIGSSLSESKLELFYGSKQQKNLKKPQLGHLKKLKTKFFPSRFTSTSLTDTATSPKPGSSVSISQVFKVGDLVEIQGTTKGRGFAGAMKRYGFHGGPKTHGQSDRSRATGSIGSGTTPGRIWKGKRMPGHYGVDTQTIKGLKILFIDDKTKEVWVSGPIPGHINSFVKLHVTGKTKTVELDLNASGISKPVADGIAENNQTKEVIEVKDSHAESGQANESK